MSSLQQIFENCHYAAMQTAVTCGLSDWSLVDERSSAAYPLQEGEWGRIEDLNYFALPDVPALVLCPNGTDDRFRLSKYKQGKVVESRIISGKERNRVLEELSAIEGSCTE